MADTLFVLLLSILGSGGIPSDPNLFTEQNEAVEDLKTRLIYALDWLSGDQIETYVRLGAPTFIEKVEVPKDDLSQAYGRGKPKEELITEERWFYPSLPEPLIFQPKKTGEYVYLRRPQSLIQMAGSVYSEPVSYRYDYGKDSLDFDFVVAVYELLDTPDSVEVAIDLIIPVSEIDSGYVFRVIVQDSKGRVLRRDSSFVRLPADVAGTGEIIGHHSLYLQAPTFIEERGSYILTGYTHLISFEILSGKKGELNQVEVKL